MGSLQGPVICHAIPAKQAGVHTFTLPVNGPLTKGRLLRSELWEFRGTIGYNTKRCVYSRKLVISLRKCRTVKCSLSSSNGNGTEENFDVNDEDYVNSSIVEADMIEVKSGLDGFMVKMRNCKPLRCVRNNPQAGHFPEYAPHPAIVLKMEDGTGLILPILVSEIPSVLLMAAVRNIHIGRPTMYSVVKEMIDNMGYRVKLVRITKCVRDAYFAKLYISKVGTEMEFISFDLLPSDAINIAVRCQVPIQVNKSLVYRDGMRVIESEKPTQSPASSGLLFKELDRPTGQPCLDTKEFDLVCNMLEAAVEERYGDAAQWRDKLHQFRAERNLRKHT